MTSTKRAFTLVELLVVIAMIAMIMGALTTSVSGAMERARIQKATAEVKAITQAILGYENLATGYRLPALSDAEADTSSLGFLLGKKDDIPVLLQASLSSGGKMLDPWGRPYRVKIRAADGDVQMELGGSALQTGLTLPNLYRLSKEERR